ncbi:hypothetical protein [Sphingobium sp. HWE2-09]|uniref:hypothetical protein n=1 Tax=Sphingobium sp. HWE2-09 TaxID=3108390 RepID=UPI002DC9463A|nr:hypothetical protein [Sphingobium sp. HWE2-09]
MTTFPAISLQGGNAISRLRMGSWQLPDHLVAPMIVWAVELRYRHFNTAAAYGDEVGEGQGLRIGGLDCDDILVTTTLWSSDHGSMRRCVRSTPV